MFDGWGRELAVACTSRAIRAIGALAGAEAVAASVWLLLRETSLAGIPASGEIARFRRVCLFMRPSPTKKKKNKEGEFWRPKFLPPSGKIISVHLNGRNAHFFFSEKNGLLTRLASNLPEPWRGRGEAGLDLEHDRGGRALPRVGLVCRVCSRVATGEATRKQETAAGLN